MLDAPRIVFDSRYLTVYDPWTIPANFHGLELVIGIGFLLTLRHAIARHRSGDRWPLFLWLTTLSYGVWMELLTYNTVDNFSHAQFTVMLYYKQLPLYVVMLYPTFVYVAVQSARRLGMGSVGTFFTVGLLAVMIDVPFDIMGPDCKWWWWNEDAEDPWGLVAHRWLGVPVSSYCWHLLFEGSQWLVAHRLRGRVDRFTTRSVTATILRALPLAAIAGALSVVVGVIVMMPFHLFRGPLGFNDGVFTVTLLVVASLAFLTARKRGEDPPDWGLLSWILLWNFFFLALGYWAWLGGGIPQVPGKAIVIGGVAVVSVVIHTYIHWRRAS
jgi:hypothetical protein